MINVTKHLQAVLVNQSERRPDYDTRKILSEISSALKSIPCKVATRQVLYPAACPIAIIGFSFQFIKLAFRQRIA